MKNLLNNYNPINTIENIIVAMVVVLFMNFFVVKPLRTDMHKLQKEIIELAKEPRYQIENDFGKMKAKDGSLVLDLNNNMNTQNLQNTPADTIRETDRTFWDKIFFRK
jgi:hypothetical protein